MSKPENKIITGLKEVIEFQNGDESKARVTVVEVGGTKMSNPLSYATTILIAHKESPPTEAAYFVIKEFLDDCILEGRGTAEGEFVYVLNDLNKQYK